MHPSQGLPHQCSLSLDRRPHLEIRQEATAFLQPGFSSNCHQFREAFQLSYLSSPCLPPQPVTVHHTNL